MGPAPKPAAQRRRQNKPKPPAAVLPAAGNPAAEVPPLVFENEPSPFTMRWWEAVWTSPMAVKYTVVDGLALVRMAQLVERMAVGRASPQDLSEIRQLEDRFGLNPLSRRRLGWEIEDDKPADEELPDNVTDVRAWRARLA